jgi:hypothetical protein
MKVYDSRLGRLGNALFRYFASTLFCIIYNAERIYDPNQSRQFFNDSMFIQWSNFVLEDKIPQIINKFKTKLGLRSINRLLVS